MNPPLCRYDNDLFAGPLSWLAIMILRDGGDVRKIFENIAASRLLCKLDKKSFAYWQMHSTIKFFATRVRRRTRKSGPATLVCGCHMESENVATRNLQSA